MNLKVALLMNASLLVLAACAEAESRQTPPPPVFTAKQTAEIDRLVASIKRASRDSVANDDWSIMAGLYPPGTFSCWVARNSEKPYSFLSKPGMPDDARHEVRRIDNYHFGNVDSSKMGATHFVEITHSVPYMAKCGDSVRRTRPSQHFYLRQRGDAFELAYPCPGDPRNIPPGFRSRWPSFSVARARKVADDMTPDERIAIRRRLLSEPIPVSTILNLQTRYEVSDEESYVMIDRICELTSKTP